MSEVGDELVGEEAESATAYFCDSNHLHVVLSDDGGCAIASIALEFEEGVDLIHGLMRQIEEMTGLVFFLMERGDLGLEEDTIGETVGNA